MSVAYYNLDNALIRKLHEAAVHEVYYGGGVWAPYPDGGRVFAMGFPCDEDEMRQMVSDIDVSSREMQERSLGADRPR